MTKRQLCLINIGINPFILETSSIVRLFIKYVLLNKDERFPDQIR